MVCVLRKRSCTSKVLVGDPIGIYIDPCHGHNLFPGRTHNLYPYTPSLDQDPSLDFCSDADPNHDGPCSCFSLCHHDLSTSPGSSPGLSQLHLKSNLEDIFKSLKHQIENAEQKIQ